MMRDVRTAVLQRCAFKPLSIRRSYLALLLLAPLALSACENSGIPLISKPIVLPCPGYQILEDASALTKFQDGPGRDITDIAFKAEMREIRLACLSEIDKETNSGHMEIEVAPVMLAEMGSAIGNENATLPYFVVVTDPEKKILYREELAMQVSFKGNRTRLVATAPATTVVIPITPKIRNNYYIIYGGFALTPEQTEYNRKLIRDRLQ